jgi:Ca2+-binding RTX toxin-like protein
MDMAFISGTPGNDPLISGTSNNDTIFGNLGDDVLDGNGGADEFIFNNVINVLNLGDINDVYIYSTDGFDIIQNFDSSNDDSVISIDPTTNFRNYVYINTSVGVVEQKSPGSGRTEYILGTTNSDKINGTSADDVIYSSSGNDIVYGKDGNDTLYGDSGDDSLYGGADSDTVYGGSGNDYLSGGDEIDELYGGYGNDILDGGNSSDILIGGIGNDTYIADGNKQFEGYILLVSDSITEKFNEGTDTVQSSDTYQLGDNLENLVLTGSSDIDGLGNALDNRIEGNAGQNFLVGGDGNDYLRGYAGNDILVGETGNDTLSGGTGNDFLNGGAGKDTLAGRAGSDTLTGGAGADRFVFSSSSDGIDIIKDFKFEEGDKIQILASGFGIMQDDLNKFTFNSTSNALFFGQVQLASLQPGSNFNPSLDILIF